MSDQYLKEGNSPANETVQPTILIVDDHALMRAALLDWLRATFPNCSFVEVMNGEDALKVAVAQPADIVLIDFNLPEMTGVEVTRRIKVISAGIQVVIMSFFEDRRYRADAETAGASAFVPKRTMPDELPPILTRLLAQVMTAQTKDERTL